MSTRSSIINIEGVHIYHEWADEEYVYVNSHVSDADPYRLCSLEDWYKIVKFIKESPKDVNGYDILTGKMSWETGSKPLPKEDK